MAETEQTGDRPIDPPLARVLKGEASQEEEAAVREWRRASYENEVEYRELVRVVEWSARTRELLEIPPRPAAADLIRRSALLRGGSAWLTAAAVIAALLGALVYSQARRRSPAASGLGIREIATSKTETATLELLDGTVIRLAPSSRLQMLAGGGGGGGEGGGTREVALEGRGFFAIAHDGTPFVIRTDAGNVTVLGTRLDLEARGRGLRVVVVE